MTLVFVYGTLKRGFANHHFLEGQAFVGVVRKGDDIEGVSGEVWSVGDEGLARMDLLECTAEGLYRREAVPLAAPFSEQRVEAYIYLKGIKDRRKVGPEWLR